MGTKGTHSHHDLDGVHGEKRPLFPWVGAMALWCACGGGGKGQDAGMVDLAALWDREQPEDAAEAGAGPETPLVVAEDFRVVYAYAGRPATEVAGRFEFRLADPRDSDPANDEVLLATSAGETLDCSMGCFLDRGLRFLAVARGVSEGGYAVQVYGLDGTNEPTPVGEPIPGVARAVWAGSVLFYSQKVACPTGTAQTTRCFEVYRYDPTDPSNPRRLTQMPPVEEEGLKTAFQYNGYFTVGEDNKTLIFFVPTYESLSVWVYREGRRVKVLGPICAARDPYGNCIAPTGGGAMYREDNPVALSADGRTLVFPLLEENRELRLYRHEIGDPEPRFSTLLSVPSDYLKNACYNREPWQFTEVRGPLRFSRDGREVLFIGASSCEDERKPWTNVLAVEVAKIGGGAPLREQDFRKVTDNPQTYTARAIAISDFDVSPSGEYVVLVGTPTVDMEGRPLPAQPGGRHERDSEVHVTRADGSTLPVQITNDVTWRAEHALAVPTP